MTYRVAVCYGTPRDQDAFDKHYESVHIALANAIPGLTEFTWGKARALDGGPGEYYAVANLYFDTENDLQSALQSAQMREAAGDLENFADGGATLFVQEEKSVKA